MIHFRVPPRLPAVLLFTLVAGCGPGNRSPQTYSGQVEEGIPEVRRRQISREWEQLAKRTEDEIQLAYPQASAGNSVVADVRRIRNAQRLVALADKWAISHDELFSIIKEGRFKTSQPGGWHVEARAAEPKPAPEPVKPPTAEQLAAAKEKADRRRAEAAKAEAAKLAAAAIAAREEDERKAAGTLKLIRKLIDDRKTGFAKESLLSLVKSYPRTAAAGEARKILASLP